MRDAGAGPGHGPVTRAVAWLLLPLMIASPVGAQTPNLAGGAGTSTEAITLPPSTSRPPPQAGAVDPASYRLGPGDALMLSIWGPISRTQVLEVGPEGQVFVAGAGSIPVSGMTLAAARERLERLVGSQYRDVHIEVRLARVRTLLVYLTGEVTRPGVVNALGSSRVVDVLTDTLFAPGASHRNVVLRHTDGSTSIVDMGGFLRSGTLTGDAWLRDGDVIYVPPEIASVGVWGGVALPGRYELGPRDSLSTIVRLAGGLLPAALPDSALFVRWRDAMHSESTWVEVAAVQSRAFNPILNDRDNFYVFVDPGYRQVHKVSVVGEVVRAGDYVIEPGATRFSTAIHQAGGFRPDADIASIQLLRGGLTSLRDDPEFGRLLRLPRESMSETEYMTLRSDLAALSPQFRIDWNRIVRGPETVDPALQDGDIIRVNRFSNTVRVDGQVRNPGVYEYGHGKGLEYYVELAGGYTDRARISRTMVTREVNGQTVPATSLRTLDPGDFVWVPERSDKTLWQNVSELLIVGGAVATIFIAFRR